MPFIMIMNELIHTAMSPPWTRMDSTNKGGIRDRDVHFLRSWLGRRKRIGKGKQIGENLKGANKRRGTWGNPIKYSAIGGSLKGINKLKGWLGARGHRRLHRSSVLRQTSGRKIIGT
jgi:hypothetical protein